MQFEDVLATRPLMEFVDVLRDDGNDSAPLFPNRRAPSAPDWAGLGQFSLQMGFLPPSLFTRSLARQVVLIEDWLHLRPDAVGSGKSGIPLSVLMPAPVNTTACSASLSQWASVRRGSLIIWNPMFLIGGAGKPPKGFRKRIATLLREL